MEIASGVEGMSVTNDVFFQLLVIRITSWFDEKGGRGAAIADDDAFLDETSACFPHIFFDRPEESAYTLITALEANKTHSVSHRRPLSLLIQSSMRPLAI
jgi:hypothetical protein